MVQPNPITKSQNIYASSQLRRAENFAAELSLIEQLWLMEWLAQHIRESALRVSQSKYDALAAMAGDQDIQREIRDISVEFSVADSDGLDKYQ